MAGTRTLKETRRRTGLTLHLASQRIVQKTRLITLAASNSEHQNFTPAPTSTQQKGVTGPTELQHSGRNMLPLEEQRVEKVRRERLP